MSDDGAMGIAQKALKNANTSVLAALYRKPTLEEIIAREGIPFTLFGDGQLTAAAGGAGVGSVNTLNPPFVGQMVYAKEMRGSVDQTAQIQIAIGPDAGGRFPGIYDRQSFGVSGGILTTKLDAFLRPFMYQNGIVNISIRKNPTAGSLTYNVGVGLSGHLLTDDMNWNAPYAIVVAGDSISAGTGPTKTANMYHFIIRDWLTLQGYDCRLVLKARSGSNTAEHESWRKGEQWHKPATYAGMGWYALGTNDAVQGVSPAVSVANLSAYWTWWHALYPTAPLVVFGPPPMNEGHESNAVALRSAFAAFVATTASPQLKFVDFGSAFTATDSTKYTDNLHPTDAGHALMGAIAIAQFQAQGIYPA
jgi:lysophospholipase L1-like esterase